MSIRNQILLIVALVAMLPLTVGALFGYWQLQRALEERQDAHLATRAREIADNVDSFLAFTLENIRADSQIPNIANYLAAPPALRSGLTETTEMLLNNVVIKDPVHTVSAALLNAKGERMMDTSSSDSSAELSAPYFRRALAEGVPQVDTEFVPGNMGVRYVLFASPVRDRSGLLLGMLRLRYEGARLRQALVYDPRNVGRGIMAYLVDDRNALLAQVGERPGARPRIIPTPAHGVVEMGWQGDQARTATISLGAQPWRVVVVQDRATYFAPIHLARRHWLVLAIAAALLLAVAARIAARRLGQPIAELTAAARDIAGGRLDTGLPTQASGEVGMLAGAVQTMVQSLRLRIEEQVRAEAELRRSEERFAALFNLSPVPMALLDLATHRCLDMNEAAARLLGYDPGQMPGNGEPALFFVADPQQAAEIWAALEKSGRYMAAELSLRGVAEPRICQVVARVVSLHRRPCVIWSAVDVTERINARRHIEELNTTLEARVAERTNDLEQAMRRLEQATDELIQSEKLAALGNLVAAVAHELNTPIGNGLLVATALDDDMRALEHDLQAERLKRSMMVNWVAKNREGTAMLIANLTRASTLVNNFKQVAVDQTSERRRVFDVAETLREVVSTLQPMLRKTPFRLEVDLAPNLLMDGYPGPLGQIINNFVANALLHGFDGRTRGSMRLETRPAGAGRMRLSFSDDGVGIPPEHRARLFDPFFTTKLGMGGSGLGLHIVYNIVTALMGGKIHVDSLPGEGTRFELDLPLVARDR